MSLQERAASFFVRLPVCWRRACADPQPAGQSRDPGHRGLEVHRPSALQRQPQGECVWTHNRSKIMTYSSVSLFRKEFIIACIRLVESSLKTAGNSDYKWASDMQFSRVKDKWFTVSSSLSVVQGIRCASFLVRCWILIVLSKLSWYWIKKKKFALHFFIP